jgi:hypothetical protein
VIVGHSPETTVWNAVAAVAYRTEIECVVVPAVRTTGRPVDEVV